MAQNLEQAVKIHFEKVFGTITPAIMRDATRAAANEAIAIIRERNEKGLDIGGNKFSPARGKAYMKRKAKLMKRYRGRFAAESPEDWMRLSGGLFRAMSFKSVKVTKTGRGLTTQFTLYVKGAKQQAQLEGLMQRRKLWPLSRRGTSQRGKEDARIMRRFRDVIRVRAQNGSVT